ncbi:MAG: hypothetical protein ACYTG0_04425 [Planctomycetota bacterium]|jgi:hypothetical protein
MSATTPPEEKESRGRFSPHEIATRKQDVKDTLRCPYCDGHLSKWRVPHSPFIEWPSEFQYICFNDACVYFVEGWSTMASQAAIGSYRFMFDPPTDGCHPLPVLTPEALLDGIVPEDG